MYCICVSVCVNIYSYVCVSVCMCVCTLFVINQEQHSKDVNQHGTKPTWHLNTTVCRVSAVLVVWSSMFISTEHRTLPSAHLVNLYLVSYYRQQREGGRERERGR